MRHGVMVRWIVVAWWWPALVLAQRASQPPRPKPERVRPGISVLLSDRIGLVQGRRVALLTNQTGVDERGRADIDLFMTDDRATKARVRLVALFAPEHGIRGTEDRQFVGDERDATVQRHALGEKSPASCLRFRR